MGDSYTARELTGKIYKTAKNLSDPAVKKRFMAQVMVDMDKILVTEVHKDLRGKDHFTNWPRKGTKAAIKSRNYVDANPAKVYEEYTFGPQARSFGPLWVADYGRHRDPKTGVAMQGPMLGPLITKGSSGSENGWHKNRKISRKKRKKWNGATKPMYTWRKATNRMEQTIPRQITTEYTKIMIEQFK